MLSKVFYVTREISFFASHNLEGKAVHIHQFVVEITFMGKRGDFTQDYSKSLLINFYEIDSIWKKQLAPNLIGTDQRIQIRNSSCENLAEWIFDELQKLHAQYENCNLFSVKLSDGDVTVTVKSNE